MRAALTTIAFAGFLRRVRRFPRVAHGVLLKPSGVARETQGEGVHFIGPFADSDVYDLRAHEQTEDLAALSADGGMIEARASVLTYTRSRPSSWPSTRGWPPTTMRWSSGPWFALPFGASSRDFARTS